LALGATLALFELLLPVFARFAGLPSENNIFGTGWLVKILLILFSCGIAISGIYPAIFQSRFKPIEFLRSKSGPAGKIGPLRHILVFFQFLISISLITWTLSAGKQISFLQNQDLGIRIEKVVSIRVPRVFDDSYPSSVESFRSEVLKIPDIHKICIVSEVPGRQIFWDAGGIYRYGSDESKNYQIVGIDYSFADVFDITFASGRNFSREFPSDSSALILNETAVKWMGFQDVYSAIGEKVDYWGDIFTIVGVMKDYRQQSPKEAFEPHIYRLMPYGIAPRGFFVVAMESNETGNTMKQVQDRFDSFFPDNAFEYFAIDEYYNEQYDNDRVLVKIFAVFSILAIFITVLGIIGLTSYMILQRTKELSIRIIMGAQIPQIFGLFYRGFLILILAAASVSAPLCILTLKKWLLTYELKMGISPWLFIVSLVIVLVTTTITTGILVIRTARTNAAENLRYE
jgi:putative ABC transport system permease protein